MLQQGQSQDQIHKIISFMQLGELLHELDKKLEVLIKHVENANGRVNNLERDVRELNSFSLEIHELKIYNIF